MKKFKKQRQLLLVYFAFQFLLSLVGPLLLDGQMCGTWCSIKAQTQADRQWWPRFKSIFQGEAKTTKPVVLQTEAPDTLQSLTQRYAGIYHFINGVKKSDYDSLLQAGMLFQDTLQGLIYRKYQSVGSKIDSNYQVYGWHPYWMGKAYKSYNFKLLSTVSYFSYDLNPLNGSYQNPEVIADWKQTELVALAHAAHCKVQLTVSCHITADIREFLDNQNNQQSNLADSLILLLAVQNADGINLNFEMPPSAYAAAFTRFVQKLSRQLKSVRPEYQLTLTLPKVDYARFFQVELLAPYVDHFILMGYDYHYSGSSRPGPIAPLRGRRKSIEQSVDSYVQQSLDGSYGTGGIARKKLLLGLPYYGGLWQYYSQNEEAEFVQSLTYRAIRDQFTSHQIRYDSLSGSAYVLVKDAENKYRECWFEDSTSLSGKYAWVKEEQLGGIAIWALGYDNGYNDLWGLLDQSFAVDSIGKYGRIAAAGLATEGLVFNIAEVMRKHYVLLITAALFLIVFTLVGFITGIFNADVRAVFFANQTYRLIYIVGIFIMIVSAYIVHRLLSNSEEEYAFDQIIVVLAIALLLGSSLTFIINKWYANYREKLP